MPAIAIHPSFATAALAITLPTSTVAIANTIPFNIAGSPIPSAQATNITIPNAPSPQENATALVAKFLSKPHIATITIPRFVCHSSFNACRTKVTALRESTDEEKRLAARSLYECHLDFRSCAGLGPGLELSQPAPPHREEHKQMKRITDLSTGSFPAQQLEQPRRNRTRVASVMESLSRLPHVPILPRSEEELAGSKDGVPILPRSQEGPASPKGDTNAFSARVDKTIILPREETEGVEGRDPEAVSLHLAGTPKFPVGFQSRKGATGATKLPDNGYYPYSHCPPACGSRTVERQHGETYEECYCL